MKYAIGVDIGGTKIRSALINDSGKVIKKYKTYITSDRSRDAILSKIIHSIKLHMNSDVIGIGIGVPAFVNMKHDKIYTTNISVLQGFNLKKLIKSKFKIPVFIDNDANCFTLAESKFGVAKNYKTILGLTLGTGVGGGIIINGDLFHGKDGFAGELGHICIDKNGYLCNCGNRGCLEMYVSGTAIETRALRHITIRDIPTKLTENNHDVKRIHAYAKKGDKLAKLILDDTAKYLGIGLTSLNNVFNPDLIVLGGSVSKIYPYLRNRVNKTILSFSISPKRKPNIKVSKLKYSGAIGAAYLVFKNEY
jgi:glucokinase